MSRTLVVMMTMLAIAITPATAMAGNGKGNGKNQKVDKVFRVAPETNVVVQGKAGHCPPGLAKKAVPCVPPGQAKKLYNKGDYITRDYRWINDPYRYGLRRDGYYVRAGDYVYRVDPDTQKVLNLIGAVADILY
ncbi:hypothetical protein [Ruegeria lacuscaerulensis]|uniref:hypothetical protein n=1 Tax=Ruegeria lacuscaerulensis TaxID=55218 RepID=UPI0014805518|nr:hypothetical protein [Ruegeria lacuscaerulensis]